MSLNITGISPIQLPQLPPPDSSTPATGKSGSFGDIFQSALGQVQDSGVSAQDGVNRFLNGEGDDLHSTVLSVQRADLEFNLFLQVRNKVVAAYQEIMRMQV